ncbi:flagellar protein FlaG [Acetivibrio cellulolyticus]|uniref:flagellar protein FlaG n=1 Tax=Acetivibrio cellulolyticus TaxID=35830 RepID=UPI0001E2E345|nr:flagellar protein FlaG [Acetivibrio cellulolyticus]
MKIESMDADSYSNKKNQISDNSATSNSNHTIDTLDNHKLENKNRNILHLSEYEKNELSVSDKVVIDAIQKANKAITGANTEFEFSIHEKTKQIMVKIINSDTHEVIKEIPPEKILDMVAKMWEMAGIMVDERR